MMVIIQVIAATIGTIAFGAFFGVPREYYPYCGAIGGAGWAVYAILWGEMQFWSEPTVVFIATVFVIFLSRLCAVWKKCPVTIFLIAGIFPLVPGAGIYWTSYYLVTDQLALASQRGFLAIKVATAIVLGIVFVFEIPQSFFGRIVHGKKRS
jgi:uncharacterized membrane protein YjjB (DUF3815 family)